MTIRIDEEKWQDSLKHMVGNGIANARDRALYGAGKQLGLGQRARGRLDVSAGTAKIMQDWNRFVGQKQRAGNRTIQHNPTVHDLVNFLAAVYNYRIDDAELRRILSTPGAIESNDAEPQAAKQPEEAPEKEADPDALGPLYPAGTKPPIGRQSRTTREEYELLRSLYPLTEAPVAADDEEEADAPHPAHNYTFNPRVVFPQIAEFMINAGHMQINRGGDAGSTTGSGGATASAGIAAGADAPESTESRNEQISNEVFNGFKVDVKKLRDSLRDRVNGSQMNEMRAIVSQGPQGYTALRKNEDARNTMFWVVNALFQSIRKDNTAQQIDSHQENVTSSGNSVDMKKFMTSLKRYGVSGETFSKVRQDLAQGNESGDVKEHLMSKLGTDDKEARMIFNIAHALSDAIFQAAPAQKAA